jgi:hypothetical protein
VKRPQPVLLVSLLALWGAGLATLGFVATSHWLAPAQDEQAALPTAPSSTGTIPAPPLVPLVPLAGPRDASLPPLEVAIAPDPPPSDAGPTGAGARSVPVRAASAGSAGPLRPDQELRLRALQRLCDQGTVTAVECAKKRSAILKEH